MAGWQDGMMVGQPYCRIDLWLDSWMAGQLKGRMPGWPNAGVAAGLMTGLIYNWKAPDGLMARCQDGQMNIWLDDRMV